MLRNSNLKFILFPIIVVVMLAAILIVVFINGQPKTPATAEQVHDVLANKGYTAVDLTDDYRKELGVGDKLINAVSAEVDDIRFVFFVFDSDESAEAVRKQYQSFINTNRYAAQNIEISEGATNFMKYTIIAKGLYTINMRVSNTLIFAECKEENAGKLSDIMIEIGYFDE